MTKIVGLTGGIGSGKTTVARYMETLGIPVYIADEAGKKILEAPENIQTIKGLFGEAVFTENRLDKKKLAQLVFKNPDKLSNLNAIIHPQVSKDFTRWLAVHKNDQIVIKEAAILFESGTYKDCDAVITVIAPLETRIRRVMARDKITEQQVIERMQNQWTDEKRAELSDYLIINEEIPEMHQEVKKILKKMRNI